MSESEFLPSGKILGRVRAEVRHTPSVLACLPWSVMQQLQSVPEFCSLDLLYKGVLSHHPALIDLHWQPIGNPQHITYKLCMIMFK